MSRLAGRWDLTVTHKDKSWPSWLELMEVDHRWIGRFVGEVGHCRAVPTIRVAGDELWFALPRQYEGFDLTFHAKLKGDRLEGMLMMGHAEEACFVAYRAPVLPPVSPSWGEPIDLIAAGESAWKPKIPSMGSNWTFGDVLDNSKSGSDLITVETFRDFKLEAHYKYPAKSNSGIYLRGRYEVQVLDDHGDHPSVQSSGGIYGFYSPAEMAVKPAGETNVTHIELLGRHVKVDLNGVRVVEGEIPGITGGALDSNESEPGPLFLQGDHGAVTFEKLILTPAK